MDQIGVIKEIPAYIEEICVYPEYTSYISLNFALILSFMAYKIFRPEKLKNNDIYIELGLLFFILMINTQMFFLHLLF